MSELFNKLNIGNCDEILVLNEPEGFCTELDQLKGIVIRESVIRTSEIDFALIFVTEKKQIENRIDTIYPKLIGDTVIWFAYPRDASKTNLNENEDWSLLGDYNLKKIDSLVINDDWIAIRFRKVKFM